MEFPDTSIPAQARTEHPDTTPASTPEAPILESQAIGVANAVGRVVRNVGVLDLTGLDGPDALDGVTGIHIVGVILAPQALLAKLGTIPMTQIGSAIPAPTGTRPRMFTGDIILSCSAAGLTRPASTPAAPLPSARRSSSARPRQTSTAGGVSLIP